MPTNEELAKRVEVLTDALKKLKDVFDKDAEIIISFSGDRNEPYRDIRLYTKNGIALGFGKLKLNEAPEVGKQDDLFAPVSVGLTYSATLKTKELFIARK